MNASRTVLKDLLMARPAEVVALLVLCNDEWTVELHTSLKFLIVLREFAVPDGESFEFSDFFHNLMNL